MELVGSLLMSSLIGKHMIDFMDQRLKEVQGNQLPFGGMNLLFFGDLHQLKPVKDGWIFTDKPVTDKQDQKNISVLGPNIFRDNFKFFELDEIMRQRDDKTFAESLNRFRTASHNAADIDLLKSRLITQQKSLELSDVPHFFTSNDNVDAYNQVIMERGTGNSVILTAVDEAPTDIPKSERRKVLGAAKVKPFSAAGNLAYQLTVKEGVRYDITANASPKEGIVNGAECTIRHIPAASADTLPICIWVEFSDGKIGKELRKSVGHHYRKEADRGWTPITPIRRTFVATQNNIKVTRLQFPLRMSAARTVHKAQSSTHKEIVVDMSGCEKAPRHYWEHMHYVAFSRCTHLQGLHILAINEENIRSSAKVTTFLQQHKRDLELCYSPTYKIPEHLNIAFNNIGCALNKWPALENNQNILNADIVVIAETWLSAKQPNGSHMLDGFQQLRMDSNYRIGHRGILMFIRDHIPIVSVHMHQTEHLEFAKVVVTHDHKKWNIIGVYKPPQTSYSTLMDELSDQCSSINNDEPIVLLGDFNINITDNHGKRFLHDMDNLYNLTQMVDGPTTWEGTHIDMVFTNIPESEFSSHALVNTWSKHHLLMAHYPQVNVSIILQSIFCFNHFLNYFMHFQYKQLCALDLPKWFHVFNYRTQPKQTNQMMGNDVNISTFLWYVYL